jgi:protein O-GlcNAc transferase
MVDPHQLLRDALAYHRAGNFDSAAQKYGALVQAARTSAPAAKLLAQIARKGGEDQAATRAIENLIGRQNSTLEGSYTAGLRALSTGDLESAMAAFKQAGTLAPDSARVKEAIGRVHLGLGNTEQSKAHFENAILISPSLPEAHSGLGRIAMAEGAWDLAEDHLKRALEHDPASPVALYNLGILYIRTDKLNLAVERLEQVVVIAPKLSAAWCALVDARMGLREWPAALDAALVCVRLDSDDAIAHDALGRALAAIGRTDEALTSFQHATRLNPSAVGPWNNLGALYRSLSQASKAIECIDHALKLDPERPQSWNNRGLIHLDAGEADAARMCFERAVSLNPRLTAAHLNLAHVVCASGALDETINCYRAALEVQPSNPALLSRLVMAMHYSPRFAPARLRRAAERWAEQIDQRANRPNISEPDPDRALRIGYVSADLRDHPVGRCLAPLTEAQRNSPHTIIAYSNHAQHDHITARIEAAVDQFVEISHLGDAPLAQRISDDKIDVLVDLSGHTAGNRLSMFALRPAPVQLTWMGFFGTTGLRVFDGLITSRGTLPESAADDIVEPAFYLNRSEYALSPKTFPTVPITPPPSLMGEGILFGCFNNPLKFNLDVVRLWVQVLEAVPCSRLLLRYPHLDPRRAMHRTATMFEDAGLPPDRLLLEPGVDRGSVFAEYGRIDIAFDPHPVNGGATTMEALWMGVPVLTLAGDRRSSRAGATMLRAIGHPEWVLSNNESFVQKAVDLAQDEDERLHLRKTLRSELQMSPLLDPAGLADELDKSIRTLWRQICSETSE